MGLANDVGAALSAFSGAIVAQSSKQVVPKGTMPITDANTNNEGLLGLVYDVATAPTSYGKGKTEVSPVQALSSLQSQPEMEE
jgi:hypothetical protein